MSRFGKFGRSLFVVVMVMLMASPTLAAQANQEYLTGQFVSADGLPALSNIEMEMWRDGSAYTVQLFVIPTDDEIAALRVSDDARVKEWSHVDFYLTFTGLNVPVGGPRYYTDMSPHVRFIDDDVMVGYSGPIVQMLGFNLGRWDDDAGGFYIEATVHGRASQRGVLPEVSVEMRSSTWWTVEGNCRVTGYKDKNDEDTCALWGPSYQLLDSDGYATFPIEQ